VDQAQQFNGNRINVGHCNDNTYQPELVAGAAATRLPYEGCRASVVDEIHKLPEHFKGNMEQKGSDMCSETWCEAALINVNNGKCLTMGEAPKHSAPQPKHFPMEDVNCTVLSKVPFHDPKVPYFYDPLLMK